MNFYSELIHRIPVSSGLTKLSFNRIINKQFSSCDRLLTARLLNGILITVEANDYHGRILYLFGTNDPKVHTVVQELLSPGDRFLDIGANYSSIGLLATDSVGPTGQIHLFEPQLHISQFVQDAISKAGLSNVHLHQVALLDHDDEMQLARPKDHSGMATLVKKRNQDSWENISVPVKDIATYVKPIVNLFPFGAKLDIEGAEPFIMPWLLAQPNLKFLVFEADHNHQELLDMVMVSGMVLYGLRRQVFFKQISKVKSLEDLRLYHDLVAVRMPDSLTAPQHISPHKLGKMLKKASPKTAC